MNDKELIKLQYDMIESLRNENRQLNYILRRLKR